MRASRRWIFVTAILIGSQLFASSASANHGQITGRVTDSATGAGVAGVCVWLGVVHLSTNCTYTDASGSYTIGPGLPDLLAWDLFFHKAGYADLAGVDYGATIHVVVDGATSVPAVQLSPAPTGGGGGGGGGGGSAPVPAPVTPAPAANACVTPGDPTSTLYLPNVTKTLGGPTGWQTPFIVQNVGTADTTLEVSFYRFSDGSLVTCRQIRGLRPGTSFADVPDNDLDLPDDSQFAVVVRSFGAAVVSVVNEHQGTADRAEALSYVAPSRGSSQVNVPWLSKGAGGWLTTLIIQNLGTMKATVTIDGVTFDGRSRTSISRAIDPGRSQFVDPRVEVAFLDGYEYALHVIADQPIAIVVNAHRDDASVAAPMAMSFDGIPVSYADRTYLPFVPRAATGAGRNSRVIVQNTSTLTVTPVLTLRALGTGATTVFRPSVLIQPANSWVFDPSAVPGLADGEYSLELDGGIFAVAVGITDGTSAMAYASGPASSTRLYLPNVTRTLGGASGWTTPIVLQSAGATSGMATWYRFSDGALVMSESIAGLSSGLAIRLDPRTRPALSDGTQYAVVIDADGPLAAIVTELSGQGGDGAMAYEGIQP